MIDYQAIDPTVEVVVANDASRWGVGKSSQDYYVSVSASGEVGAVYFGAEANNADYGVGADNEIMLFGGVNTELAGFQVTVGGKYRKMIGSTLADNEAIEFFATAEREFGPVALRTTVGYSPDDFAGEKNTWFAEAGASYVYGANEISGAYGTKWGGFANSEYDAWNVGYTRGLATGLAVDVRYYNTDQGAWGEPFDDRTVVSLKVSF